MDKFIAMALSSSPLLPALLSNNLSTPVIGVSLTTVAGAVLGTYAAIGYDEAQHPRGKLFTMGFSTVILASALAGVIPRWVGWEWANGGVEAGLAAVTSLVIYYLLPPTIKRAKEIIASFKLTDVLPFRKGATPLTPPAPRPPDGEGDPDK